MTMKMSRLGLGRAVVSLGALLALACSGDDDGAGSGGSGLPADQPVSELTEAELQQLCSSMGEGAAVRMADVCKMTGLMAAALEAAFAGTADVAALRETCRSTREQCLASDPEPATTTESCTVPANCTATVGEVEACVDASAAQARQAYAAMPSCESLEASDLDGTSTTTETATTPPACAALETTCPGMVSDSSGGGGTQRADVTCGDGSTVPGMWVCDGDNDCPGGEDEVGC